MTRFRAIFGPIRRLFFYLLPPILLIIIFRRVDFEALKAALEDTIPSLIALSLALKSVPMFFGALRWRSVCLHTGAGKLALSSALCWYWAGFSIGFFTPGGLGWDAYRILAAGKRLQAYTSSFLGVLLEKILGTVSVVFLVLVMFPLVIRDMTVDSTFYTELHTLVLLGLLGLALIALIILRKKKRIVWGRVQKWGEWMVRRAARSLKNTALVNSVLEDLRHANSLGKFFATPRPFLVTMLYSLSILASSALCGHILFMGLDHEIPFRINLFAAPVLFLIFMLPISFGGLGIREGSYILVFGLFGVPVETALLVSFFSLISLMFNHGIGAILIWSTPGISSQARPMQREGA